MADKTRSTQYRYTISMAYLDQKRGKSVNILNESIKSIIIDHNYEVNCMPVLYANLTLDKKLIDDMIVNCNENLIMIALNKFDNLTDEKQEIECFRKKFTYFLPKNVNSNDSVDYTEETADTYLSNTYVTVSIGLMCVDHINNNKKSFNYTLKNTTIGEPVRQVMSHFNNLIMEPIGDSKVINQLFLPEENSVTKALIALNNIRVFYSTPFRYYQDFNFTYLLSSSGKAIKKPGELYTSVIIEIEDVLATNANEIGTIINRTSKTYQVPVNYANTQIYDNTIVNKSQTVLTGKTSSGESIISLKNKSKYLTDKNISVRLANDNEGMLDNIAADKNSTNFLVYIMKSDLDTDLFTPNKRVTINHINSYKDHNGDYLVYRKRECFMREDDAFNLATMINLKKIEK